ncbi:conserved hypothetical protein [Candidatus Zixiibacteriota bacterium]|nr:conserved hypothetical protein [candidate division Zixibacteria bacterium]
MKIFHGILIAIFAAVTISGCAVYTFNPGGKSSIKTVAVTQFDNKTVEASLTSQLTDLIVNAFIADGNLKVASEDQADAVLSGTLLQYERKPVNFTAGDTVNLYSVDLIFDITLKDRKSDKNIWSDKLVSEGVYAVDKETEEIGQSRAITKLVTDIINRTTKSW